VKSKTPKTAAVISRSLVVASGLAGQIGCVTVLILGAALAGGLWLDQQLNTKPVFTILLLLVSFPVSLALTLRIALSAVRQIEQAQEEDKKEQH